MMACRAFVGMSLTRLRKGKKCPKTGSERNLFLCVFFMIRDVLCRFTLHLQRPSPQMFICFSFRYVFFLLPSVISFPPFLRFVSLFCFLFHSFFSFFRFVLRFSLILFVFFLPRQRRRRRQLHITETWASAFIWPRIAPYHICLPWTNPMPTAFATCSCAWSTRCVCIFPSHVMLPSFSVEIS